jgi:hypothetical protein
MHRSWAIAVVTCLVLGGVPASAQVTGAHRTVVSCPEGTNPNRDGPTSSTQPMGWFLGAVFDDAAGQIVTFVSYDEQIETWALDVCTNTWTRPKTQGERPPGRDGQVVLMGDRGLVVAQVAGATDAGINTFEVWTHDLVSDRWARQGPIPWVAGVGQPIYEASSGLIMALDPPPFNQTAATELWRYDLDRDAWDAVVMSGADPGATADPLVVYDSSVGRIVAYDPEGGRTWLIDPEAGAWFEGQPGPTHRGGWSEGWARPLAVLDETTGQVIVVTIEGVFAYVPASDTWETLLEAPADDAVEPVGPWNGINRAMVYDPVNERMVVVGGGEMWGAPGWQDSGGVWAFDTRTSEWIELLTSSEPPLAIGDSAA